VRDWLHVDDHAEALLTVLDRGRLGETYCIGGDSSRRNIEIVRMLCEALDRYAPANTPHAEKITFVTDRPGHDFRYDVDASKIRDELGWTPRTPVPQGLEETVRWYVENQAWWQAIRDRGFTAERQGLSGGA
jgi:dTDP-glucose 4,6-dehydratase